MMTLWQKVATNLVETTYNDWWWCCWRSFCLISHNRWPESHAAANVNPFAMSICGMERALPPLRNAMGFGVLDFERLLLLYFRHRSVNPSNLEVTTTTNCWLLSPPLLLRASLDCCGDCHDYWCLLLLSMHESVGLCGIAMMNDVGRCFCHANLSFLRVARLKKKCLSLLSSHESSGESDNKRCLSLLVPFYRPSWWRGWRSFFCHFCHMNVYSS